jgi:hypothetical protein
MYQMKIESRNQSNDVVSKYEVNQKKTYLSTADMSNDVVACNMPLQLVYRKRKMLAVSCFSSGASRDGFHFLLKTVR